MEHIELLFKIQLDIQKVAKNREPREDSGPEWTWVTRTIFPQELFFNSGWRSSEAQACTKHHSDRQARTGAQDLSRLRAVPANLFCKTLLWIGIP